MQILDSESLNGRLCCACSHVFPQSGAIERPFTVLADSMYGRAPAPLHCVERCCPNCNSAELEPVALCDRCLLTDPEPGSDHCHPCEVAIEAEDHASFMREQRQLRDKALREELIGITAAVLS